MPKRPFHSCTSRELPVIERRPGASRRDFLWNFGGGLGGIALAHLLATSALLGGSPSAAERAALNGGVHHKGKAKRVVQLFMSGAASQCDMYDYKPELIKSHGQP